MVSDVCNQFSCFFCSGSSIVSWAAIQELDPDRRRVVVDVLNIDDAPTDMLELFTSLWFPVDGLGIILSNLLVGQR